MTIQEKFEKIKTHLNAGRTVQFSTYMVALRVTKKHLDTGLIKLSGNNILIQRGKRWDCVNFCAVRIFE